MSKLFLNTDGGSRGNPGPAGIGIVFFDENEKEIFSHKECIGIATNNEAEYGAIIKALKLLNENEWFEENNGNGGEVVCRLDSQLVVEQIKGNYKVKQEHLQKLMQEIRDSMRNFDLKIEFIHIPREQNKRADKLVNQALDGAAKSGMEGE